MDIQEYDITQKHIGILLGCIGLLFVSAYFAAPAVQAGLHSPLDSSETVYSNPYEEPDYAYSTFTVELDSEHRSYSSFTVQHDSSSIYSSKNGTEIYVVSSDDGLATKVGMSGKESGSFEVIHDEGMFVQTDGNKTTYALAFLGSRGILEDRIYTISHGPFELRDAKYEQTGTKEYQNRTVDVYKKTWTSMGLPTVSNSDKIYVDSETGMVLYMDIQMNAGYNNKKLNLKDVKYTVTPTNTSVSAPEWMDKITFYQINNSTQIIGTVSNSPISSKQKIITATLEFKPEPIEPNSTVQITTKKNGKTIGNDTVPGSVFTSRFHITSDGTIVPNDELGNPEAIPVDKYLNITKKDSVKLIVGSNNQTKTLHFRGDSLGYNGVLKVGVTTEQPYIENSVKITDSKIRYKIHDVHYARNITIQYGNQQRSPTEKTIFQYPKPENTTFVFNKTSEATHFALILEKDSDRNFVVLERFTGENTETGTIQLGSETRQDVTNTNITLLQNKTTIAKIETTKQTKYISNVPVGEVEVRIQADDGMITETVTVQKNTNVFVRDSEVLQKEDDYTKAHDAGQRPAEYRDSFTPLFKPFTPSEFNFSEEVMANTNYTVTDQASVKSDEVPTDRTFNINSSIEQSDGETKVTIHSITNASAENSIENRTGRLKIEYDGNTTEINVTSTTVNKTVTFQSTNDSYAEYRYVEFEPDRTIWGSAIYVVNVNNQSDKKGWIYYNPVNEFSDYRLYNNDRQVVTEITPGDMQDIEHGPVRIYVPVDKYVMLLEALDSGTSYRTFPVLEDNRTELSSQSILGKEFIEHRESHKDIERTPYHVSISNESGTHNITLGDVEKHVNGTVTIVYGNQTETISLANRTGNISVYRNDTGARYVKLFYSPEYTENVTQFEVHRLYPNEKGIEHWYIHQDNDTLRVYDWATQVAEFKYSVAVETGSQSRYHPYINDGSKNSYRVSGRFGNIVEVTLTDASTKSVENTTKTD